MTVVLADNLDNPKGLSFGPDGNLYIAEAGTGGEGASIPSPSGQGNLFYGTTGAITKVENGVAKRVLTGLPSVAFPDGTGAAGPHDIKFDKSGQPFVLIGLAAKAVDRDRTLADTDLGKIITVDFSTNSYTSVADIANYEVTTKFTYKEDEVVSNPLAFLIDDEIIVLVDAGANKLISSSTDGSSLKALANIPDQVLTNPIFPTPKSENFDRGHVPPPSSYRDARPSKLRIQSVPTGVVKGPDGAYYISEFTGFPFPEGGAKIYRVDVSGQLTVYAEGFTQLIDLAFDAVGNLYVLQHMNQSGWKGNPDGSLIKISPNGDRTTLLSGNGLESPSAMAIGPDDAFYIINRGGRPGKGQVLRIESKQLIPQLSEGVLTNV
ncbi:ScyD/ScyE family protein [Iningainema tapete]|uniref:ScyD/ScyE family protein n=1 Tax=Iningainema tapete BLCC-T55 TaxID=2748662 RepID=A0A8J6XNC7_9CYAN|nr:ScyD/ScyE family protein [Iningainema tapete]MBD2775054.1 ScyD/ScyE family protein [Iningainema tapete BLCC-T55]